MTGAAFPGGGGDDGVGKKEGEVQEEATEGMGPNPASKNPDSGEKKAQNGKNRFPKSHSCGGCKNVQLMSPWAAT